MKLLFNRKVRLALPSITNNANETLLRRIKIFLSLSQLCILEQFSSLDDW
jgi:hypothetical protein